MREPTTLVTGATGNIGSRVVDALAQTPGRRVIALTRDPDAAVPTGVAVRTADYADRHALAHALDGVETLVFVASDGHSEQMLIHHLNVIDAATTANVQRIVYLSTVDVALNSSFCFAPVHGETEQLLQRSGIPHAIVRSGMYGEFFARFITRAAASGVLALPIGDAHLSLVSRSDIARCLVAATEAGTDKTYEATGHTAYDLAGLQGVAQQLTSAPVRATDIDLSEFNSELLGEGMEPWWAYAFTSMFAAVKEHRFATLHRGVADLTGGSPVSFEKIIDQISAPIA